jgi:ubiquinone/menaquinone biosynthesis C-methylase UbiE
MVAMTQRVDYDRVAASYDQRYTSTPYEGVEQALRSFLSAPSKATAVLEVGCGTGRWLRFLEDTAAVRAIGVDLSQGMLSLARRQVQGSRLVRARAEQLPLAAASFDRIFCVNALHHFADARAFLSEARGLLRSGGGLMTVGLDPHTGVDRWWIYDYFPEALVEDVKRYPATAAIRQAMKAAGFSSETREVQRFQANLSLEALKERGLLERTTTSQLMVISDEAYASGIRRIVEGQNGAASGTFRVNLRLYATVGWIE